MIKKLIASFLMLFPLVSPVSIAYAQRPGLSNAPTARSQAIQKRSRAMEEIANRIHQKLQQHLNLYQKFVSKLENRRAVLASQGKDATDLDNTLRLIKTEIANTNNQLASLKQAIDHADYTLPPYQLRQELRGHISNVRNQFHQINQLLRQAIQQIIRLSQ